MKIMNTLSKEYILETKKEIQRLEGLVRTYQARIDSLQELLEDNSNQDSIPKAKIRSKASKLLNREENSKQEEVIATSASA